MLDEEILAVVLSIKEASDLTSVRTEKRFDAMDARFDAMDARFDAMDRRFDRVDIRLGRLETRIEVLEDGQKAIRSDIADLKRRSR